MVNVEPVQKLGARTKKMISVIAKLPKQIGKDPLDEKNGNAWTIQLL